MLFKLSQTCRRYTLMCPAGFCALQDDQGHVNWGVVLFSLLCIACGAVWLGLLRTWCALGSSCLSCPRKQRQVCSSACLVAVEQLDSALAVLMAISRRFVPVILQHVLTMQTCCLGSVVLLHFYFHLFDMIIMLNIMFVNNLAVVYVCPVHLASIATVLHKSK